MKYRCFQKSHNFCVRMLTLYALRPQLFFILFLFYFLDKMAKVFFASVSYTDTQICMEDVCNYVASNWVKNDVKVNVSSGLCKEFIMHDYNQQFYEWTVVTYIWCGTKRWSPCCTKICRHVANLDLLLCLFWKLYISYQADDMIIFTMANQFWK